MLKQKYEDDLLHNMALICVMLSFLTITGSSAYVRVIEPYSATLYNSGSVYMGNVGPGQTFYITIAAASTNNEGELINYGWNSFTATNLPEGWIVQNSSFNTQTLSINIRPAENAPNGRYSFNLTAINTGNYSGLGTVHFIAYVNVTPDVFKLNLSPTNVSAGIGEPTNIYITINNTGVSDNPFVVTVAGLPGWSVEPLQVIALHSTTKSILFPLYEYTPSVYTAVFHVESLASPRVYKNTNVTLVVKPSLYNDYLAIGQGALIFPIIYEPAYAIEYLISRLFSGK